MLCTFSSANCFFELAYQPLGEAPDKLGRTAWGTRFETVASYTAWDLLQV